MHFHQASAQTRRGRHFLLSAILFSTAPTIRVGLQQLLSTAGVPLALAVPSLYALEGSMTLAGEAVIVSDVESRREALEVALQYCVPLLILAISEYQSCQAAQDTTLLQQQCSVVDISAGDAAQRINEAYVAITSGQRYVYLRADTQKIEQHIPPIIERQLQKYDLSPRHIELLWLDTQGYSAQEIAEQLNISTDTVRTYWKRLQHKFGFNRNEMRAWLRQQVRPNADETLEERQVGQ